MTNYVPDEFEISENRKTRKRELFKTKPQSLEKIIT